MLEQGGFQVIRLKAHGQPRSVVLPLYLTALARPLAGRRLPGGFKARPERAVALKRRWGLTRRRALERLFPDLAWLAMS
jgi:hypothetical protein